MSTAIRVVVLHCTEQSSDKLYRMTVVENGPGDYSVTAENCRRGNSYVKQPNRANSVLLSSANQAVESTIREKRRKGYRVIEDKTLATPAATAGAAPKKAPGAKPTPGDPTSFNPKFAGLPVASGGTPPPVEPTATGVAPLTIPATDLSGLLSDPGVVMHGVKGGIQMVLGMAGGAVTGADGNHLPKALVKALEALGDGFEIEGELVDGVFHAWDIHKLNGVSLADMQRSDRCFELTYLLCQEETKAWIKPVFADDSPDKVPFFLMLQDEGCPAVQFWTDAPLSSSESRPRRFTFTKESLFIVLGKCGDGRKLELGLHPINKGDNFHRLPVEWRGLPVESTVPVGFVDVPPTSPAPRIGAVIRVAYEALGANRAIKGASYMGIEDGADETAAHMGQIHL